MADANPTPVDFAKQDVEYRDISGFPGYRVGNDGSVWSCWRLKPHIGSGRKGNYSVMTEQWKRIKTCRDKDGYLQLGLFRDGRRFARKVHRLVLNAFVGKCPNGMQCCHEDRNKENNSVGNLRWGTYRDNTDDKRKHGTIPCGEKHYKSLCTDEQAIEIRRLVREGVSRKIVALTFGMGYFTVCQIVNGRRWPHLVAKERQLAADAKAGADGPDTYSWDEGIAP